MNRTADFLYTEDPNFQMLEIPYKGNELLMTILLPMANRDLKKVMDKMNSKNLERVLNKLTKMKVQVSLPKFKAESTLNLRKNLVSMGMPLAFDMKRADFHGIRKLSPGENLFISAVVHKAFVDVNEEGTEAAAATAVVTMLGSAMPRLPKIFNANRPFVFFIRHVKSGALLFVGRYSQP